MEEVPLSKEDIENLKKKPITYKWESIGCYIPLFGVLLLLLLFNAAKPVIYIYSFFIVLIIAITILNYIYLKDNVPRVIKNGLKVRATTKVKDKIIEVNHRRGEPPRHRYNIYFEESFFESIEVKKDFFLEINVGDEFVLEKSKVGNYYFRVLHKGWPIYEKLVMYERNNYVN